MNQLSKLLIIAVFTLIASGQALAEAVVAGPIEGSKFKDFSGTTMNGVPFKLSKFVEKGTVAVVMLRGFPGYQCPVCSTQVAGYMAKSEEFEKHNTPVVFIYPGKVKDLDKRAKEFTSPLEEKVDLPSNFIFVIDNNYKITNLLDLRWNAKNETAYPAAFIIDHKGYIQYLKVSDNHHDRASADEIIEFLEIIH
ncbi:MAG: redoxin domain-containing protein [Gammaproteobacteria bacterium]|nr:redoxin domain-containing protein [Gammaproteobacteria bacterium]